MNDYINNFDVTPSDWDAEPSIIKVIGVGGGGCNAVSYMYKQKVKGCNFIVCNTDRQALNQSPVPTKIQLGEGLGAGTNPSEGRNAALGSQERIESILLTPETKMVFITAGMGGGTGTGASPVIAKMAKDKGILTVAVVTIPFRTEGDDTISKAIDGIHELEHNVDSLLIINNEKLYEYYGNLLVQHTVAAGMVVHLLCVGYKVVLDNRSIVVEGFHLENLDACTQFRNSILGGIVTIAYKDVGVDHLLESFQAYKCILRQSRSAVAVATCDSRL